MKVLHVITGLEAGGAERMLERLCLELRELKVDSRIAVLKSGGPVEARLTGRGFEIRKFGWRHTKWMKEADLVQGWMYHGNLAASLWSRTLGRKPHLWNIRASWGSYAQSKLLTKWVMRAGAALSSWPSAILYNSTVARAEHERHGFDGRHGHVIPNGFRLPAVDADARAAARARLGIRPDQPLVLTVGRFHPDKDYRTFVEAARAVVNHSPPVKFMMVGRGLEWSNPELARWIGEDRAIFELAGEHADCEAFYAAADLFVLSSATEAFPNVLGEAMSFALPCLTTNVGDAPDLLGQPNWTCAPGSPSELARKLSSILQLNEKARTDLGRENRSRIESRFGLRTIARRYAELYEQAVI